MTVAFYGGIVLMLAAALLAPHIGRISALPFALGLFLVMAAVADYMKK